MTGRSRADIVVVGAGAAGLYSSLVAARSGARVALVSASPLAESASYWAQGGLAVALAADDSPARHLADTVAAGRGTVNRSAAEVLCSEAGLVLRDLTGLGVAWDRDRLGRPALGLEGGHSARRIVHAGGAATGRRITRALSAAVAASHGITVLEGRRVRALLGDGEGCRGVELDGGEQITSRAVILATGGAAALWARTTNPPGTVGRGMVLAQAAGADLADLEFVQFHPTALAAGSDRDGMLITEAIRGEGGRLLDRRGERFVDELAPRDEVALAIHHELERHGSGSVRLDMTDVRPDAFPSVCSALAAAGIDSRLEPFPVAPAAHYVMGGIATDLNGHSSVEGLLAIGEVACTGLHGANRLASNSLTECFVFGRRAALAALDANWPGSSEPTPVRSDPAAVPSDATREALWRHAGIVRSAEGLAHLLDDPHPLARAVARCALAREETRGSHRRSDFPGTDPAADGLHSRLGPDDGVRLTRWPSDADMYGSCASDPTPQLS